MRTRRREAAVAPAPFVLLDWTASRHFAQDCRPCRHCGSPTHLRDDKGRPADKVCAEAVHADLLAIVSTYSEQGRL